LTFLKSYLSSIASGLSSSKTTGTISTFLKPTSQVKNFCGIVKKSKNGSPNIPHAHGRTISEEVECLTVLGGSWLFASTKAGLN